MSVSDVALWLVMQNNSS